MRNREAELIRVLLSHDPNELAIPRLHDYFGVWAIEEDIFRSALVGHFERTDLLAHVRAYREDEDAPRRRESYAIDRGVAVISLVGLLQKSSGSMTDSTSTVAARRQIRHAAANPDVHAILLAIESPGGTVAGTAELAADVAAAAAIKPLDAHIEDLGASAAYWPAAQARRISANTMARVGSIGTYQAINDLSGMAAKEGVKVHVLRAGEFKGAGTPGTEITHAQLAEWQRIVDQLNAHFLAGVAKGRKLSAEQVSKLADGRVHLAADAKSLGLIDAVESREETLARLVQLSQKGPQKGSRMSATIAELKAACPGASAEFILAQLDKGADVAQAAAAFISHQGAQLEQVKAKAAADLAAKQAELDQAVAKAKMPGVDPVPAGKGGPKAGADGDPIAAWNEALVEKVKAGLTKAQAAAAVNREQPELREAYVAAYNAARRKAS